MTRLRYYVFIGLLISLLFGQFGSFSLGNSVFVYLHDVLVLLFCILSVGKQALRLLLRHFSPLILFIGICVLSLCIHLGIVPVSEFLRGLLYLLRFICYSLVAVCVAGLPVSKQIIIRFLASIGSAFSMIGLMQYVFFPSLRPLLGAGWDEHYKRVFGSIFDPNFFGMMTVLSLFTLFIVGVTIKKGKLLFNRSPYWIFAGVVFISFVLTYSRSAYLALAAGSIVFVVRYRLLKQMVFIICLFFSTYLLFPQDGFDTNRITRQISSTARIDSWITSIQYIAEKPLWGHGFNLIRYRIGKDLPINTYGIVSRDRSGLNSSMLFVFATTGIIGGVIYSWWLWRQYCLFKQAEDSMVGTVGIASLVAVFVFSWFNNGLFYPWILLWLMILLGVALKKT